MKILLIGGGGFIGSAVADRLLEDGHELRIFERPRVVPYRSFEKSERIQWITGDFQSSHDATSAIEGMDSVIHLASSTLPKNSNEDPIFDVHSNLVSILNLLNAMVGAGTKRIIFASSGGTVYGIPQYLPINEEHPTNPIVSYGIVKLVIEKYLILYERMYGIKAIALRIANPYGERQRLETAQGAVGVFLHRVLKNQPVEIWGDGTITRDYIYIRDVADAFAKALEYKGSLNVLNISSGVGVSLNDLLFLMEKELGHEIVRNYLTGRPFDVPVSVLSNSLASRELSWAPKIPLLEGIGLTAAWIKKTLVYEL
ncbi:MAG: NAD-dependent epimerase/dehydratase family protein [Spirochaetia bacterium]|nr:NAD-dependent epimerase/dehydratase family protein [Spirochaetia bacterium]